ncbi:MAG: hypothetical protein ACFB4I_25155 [Cyanophyceae cyanobacterium]
MEFNKDLLSSAADVPMHRLNTPAEIIYRSAIALKIAGKHSPQLVARQLAEILPEVHVSVVQTQPLLAIKMKMAPGGWLDFPISDRALALWLQQLPQLFNTPPLTGPWLTSTAFFGLQYAHARCCSLLRLGHEQGLITLNCSCQAEWRWLKPKPIPWLSPNFLLAQPAERHLIAQLLKVTDTSYSNRAQTHSLNVPPELPPAAALSRLKLAQHLSQSVLQFERCCRIFGDIQTEQPRLSQARLGLLAIAQFFLQNLLQKQFLTTAAEEL